MPPNSTMNMPTMRKKCSPAASVAPPTTRRTKPGAISCTRPDNTVDAEIRTSTQYSQFFRFMAQLPGSVR